MMTNESKAVMTLSEPLSEAFGSWRRGSSAATSVAAARCAGETLATIAARTPIFKESIGIVWYSTIKIHPVALRISIYQVLWMWYILHI